MLAVVGLFPARTRQLTRQAAEGRIAIVVRHRRAHQLRLLCVTAALTAGFLGVPTAGVGASPSAAPGSVLSSKQAASETIGSVTDQLRRLADANEALTERYNGAQIEVQRSEQALTTTIRMASVSLAKLQHSRQALAALLAQRYRQPSFSHVGTILTSTSPTDYLARMDTLSFITRDRARVVDAYAQARSRADAATSRATAALAAANNRERALAAQRSSLQTRILDYQRRLARLSAAQRATLFTAPRPSTPPVAIGGPSTGESPAAQTAVKAAMAELGKPYVFATAGPSTFDCSGLTMYAWSAAGISIPHQSSAQFNLGSAIPADKLLPGDLVFFYSDLHHVGLYIGNGIMVHAPTEGDVVKVTPISAFGSDYMGARRVS